MRVGVLWKFMSFWTMEMIWQCNFLRSKTRCLAHSRLSSKQRIFLWNAKDEVPCFVDMREARASHLQCFYNVRGLAQSQLITKLRHLSRKEHAGFLVDAHPIPALRLFGWESWSHFSFSRFITHIHISKLLQLKSIAEWLRCMYHTLESWSPTAVRWRNAWCLLANKVP